MAGPKAQSHHPEIAASQPAICSEPKDSLDSGSHRHRGKYNQSLQLAKESENVLPFIQRTGQARDRLKGNSNGNVRKGKSLGTAMIVISDAEIFKEYPQQEDTINCGVFVLAMARALCEGKALPDQVDPVAIRKVIVACLITVQGDVDAAPSDDTERVPSTHLSDCPSSPVTDQSHLDFELGSRAESYRSMSKVATGREEHHDDGLSNSTATSQACQMNEDPPGPVKTLAYDVLATLDKLRVQTSMMIDGRDSVELDIVTASKLEVKMTVQLAKQHHALIAQRQVVCHETEEVTRAKAQEKKVEDYIQHNKAFAGGLGESQVMEEVLGVLHMHFSERRTEKAMAIVAMQNEQATLKEMRICFVKLGIKLESLQKKKARLISDRTCTELSLKAAVLIWERERRRLKEQVGDLGDVDHLQASINVMRRDAKLRGLGIDEARSKM